MSNQKEANPHPTVLEQANEHVIRAEVSWHSEMGKELQRLTELQEKQWSAAHARRGPDGERLGCGCRSCKSQYKRTTRRKERIEMLLAMELRRLSNPPTFDHENMLLERNSLRKIIDEKLSDIEEEDERENS